MRRPGERGGPGWDPSFPPRPEEADRHPARPWPARRPGWVGTADLQAAARLTRSSLVADLPQELHSGPRIFIGLDALGALAVDNAEDAAPLPGFGDDGFDGIGGGAKNGTDFGHGLDAAEHVDRITVAHGDHEHVAGGQRGGVADGERFEIGVIAVGAREAGARSFVESDPEFHLRDRVDDSFVDVLNGLDEVRLPDDDVATLGNFQANRFQFHAKLPEYILRGFKQRSPRRKTAQLLGLYGVNSCGFNKAIQKTAEVARFRGACKRH